MIIAIDGPAGAGKSTVARRLAERLGEESVMAHHGSLSKEKRLDVEARLGRAA